MKATYWLDVPNAANSTAYGAPVPLASVNTVSGKATFPTITLGFWLAYKITYEFVNASQCVTGCSLTKEYTAPQ